MPVGYMRIASAVLLQHRRLLHAQTVAALSASWQQAAHIVEDHSEILVSRLW